MPRARSFLPARAKACQPLVYMAFKGMTLLVYQRSRVPGSGLLPVPPVVDVQTSNAAGLDNAFAVVDRQTDVRQGTADGAFAACFDAKMGSC